MNKLRVTLPALAALTALAAPSAALLTANPAPAAPLTGSPAAEPLTGDPAPASAGAAVKPAAEVTAKPSSKSTAKPTAKPTAKAAAKPADHNRESVLVTGQGQVYGQPDTLTANFAVEAAAATVDAALEQATAAATRMRDSLARAGVPAADLQTTDVRVSSTKDEKEKITGYTVNQGLTAKIRNLPKAGATMAAAIAAGGDAARLNGVSFAIEDDAALLAEARRKAFADARGKAELYAREARRTLDRVVMVNEGAPSYRPYEQDRAAAMLAMADFAIPIEPGRQQLSVTVTVEWAFGAADGR
ncbi:SIMPL domain-containing protein [Actinoplanes sp. DH11]|uniref:SIMPL domain-containing protein n=1 Tax=Actinoplanes sp. DH11 TaxID=2857011 RepID=UPI002714E0C9|nr:SIMPL domain-containing protein [Actinoplanes sp. DH11]